MTLASRIGVMNHGRIVQVGTPHEIYEFPELAFRRRVHRQREHVRGPHRRGRARPRAHRTRRSWAAPIYVGHGVSAAPSAIVWVAVRPEKMLAHARAAARVRTTSRSGRDQGDRLHGRHVASTSCSSASGKMVRVTQPNAHPACRSALTWDERVWLSWHRVERRRGHANERATPMKRGYLTLGEQLTVALARLMHAHHAVGSPIAGCGAWVFRGRTLVIAVPCRLAAAVLPDSVRHRPEDQLRRARVLGMPPYTPLIEWTGDQVAADQAQPRQLPVPAAGRALLSTRS